MRRDAASPKLIIWPSTPACNQQNCVAGSVTGHLRIRLRDTSPIGTAPAGWTWQTRHMKGRPYADHATNRRGVRGSALVLASTHSRVPMESAFNNNRRVGLALKAAVLFRLAERWVYSRDFLRASACQLPKTLTNVHTKLYVELSLFGAKLRFSNQLFPWVSLKGAIGGRFFNWRAGSA